MSKSKSKTTTNATTVQTPNVPSWIEGPYKQFAGSVQGLLGANPSQYSVGATGNQRAAWQGAAALGQGPNASITDGQSAMRGLLGYTPQTVTAGQLSNTDLLPYTNPFQKDVIDASMADYENSLASMFNGLKAQTPTGAFGGSRQGVAMGQAGADAARGQAAQLAQLRAANFGQAQQAAQFDIGNRFAADQFNSGQDMAGAQFRAGVGQNLYNMGVGADANQRANLGLLGQMGADERDVEIANNPYLQQLGYLASIGGLLGQVPANTFTGQTVNESGTSKTSGSGFRLGWSAKNGFSLGG